MLVLLFDSICTILFQVFLFSSAEASSNSLYGKLFLHFHCYGKCNILKLQLKKASYTIIMCFEGNVILVVKA